MRTKDGGRFCFFVVWQLSVWLGCCASTSFTCTFLPHGSPWLMVRTLPSGRTSREASFSSPLSGGLLEALAASLDHLFKLLKLHKRNFTMVHCYTVNS